MTNYCIEVITRDGEYRRTRAVDGVTATLALPQYRAAWIDGPLSLGLMPPAMAVRIRLLPATVKNDRR